MTIKEKEARERVYRVENELGEIKDAYRMALQQLESRSRENEHLVTLLEDLEGKIALYE